VNPAALTTEEQLALIASCSPEAIKTAYKRLIGHQGGRPATMAPCPRCGAMLTTVQRRYTCPSHTPPAKRQASTNPEKSQLGSDEPTKP
jgi:hypothetical protein